MLQNSRVPEIIRELAPFKVDGLAIPYAEFVPRLYNFCMELGFSKGLIMPSRAFCSDENQGLPIILLTKHFGTFPFNHGRVGGIIAIDRHGPHANHGQDLLIVQASHVGYDPDTGIYGKYIRPRMAERCVSDSCGKLTHVINPYLEKYSFARERIFLQQDETGRCLIIAKNSFVDFASHPVKDGLVLRLPAIVKEDGTGVIRPAVVFSTSHAFEVSEEFKKKLEANNYQWKGGDGESIGDLLTSDLFYFREDFHETDESILLERNLIDFMPKIVTARNPALLAAKINVQLEFARAVESIRRGDEYLNRNLLYIAGLNIDIAQYNDYPPTTYFVPWAAHVQLAEETPAVYLHPLEQPALFARLMAQSTENPDQVNLKEQISRMLDAPRFDIRSPK
ncbi:hypothetical protein ACFL6N_06510 [Thermodesulfobacteriota bacterium]